MEEAFNNFQDLDLVYRFLFYVCIGVALGIIWNKLTGRK